MRSLVNTCQAAIRSVRSPFLTTGVIAFAAAIAVVAVLTTTDRPSKGCDPVTAAEESEGESVVCSVNAIQQSTENEKSDIETKFYPIDGKGESDSQALVVQADNSETDSDPAAGKEKSDNESDKNADNKSDSEVDKNADNKSDSDVDKNDSFEEILNQSTTSTTIKTKDPKSSKDTKTDKDIESGTAGSDVVSGGSSSAKPTITRATESKETDSDQGSDSDDSTDKSNASDDKPKESKSYTTKTTVARSADSKKVAPVENSTGIDTAAGDDELRRSPEAAPTPPTTTPTVSTRRAEPVPAPAPASLGASCRNAPALAAPSGNVVRVSSESALQSAVSAATEGTTILIAPGSYDLTSTLIIRRNNITIRGDSNRCDAVVLRGKGMENANYGDVPHGVWTNAKNLSVQNLTITDVYHHGVNLNYGAESPNLYNLMLLDTGTQHVKGNAGPSWGNGTDNGVANYLTIGYTNGVPRTDHGGGTGYVQGIDVHGGANWVIRNSHFFNFNTRDGSDHEWPPVILMWTGSKNTTVENNTFHNVTRAIALGLNDDPNGLSHSGGRVAGNKITIDPGLLSPARAARSDAAMLIWDSPGTVVEDNMCQTNGNMNLCLEFRFDTTGSIARNNSSDSPIGSRGGAQFTEIGTRYFAP